MKFNLKRQILSLTAKTTLVIFNGIKWLLLGFFILSFHLPLAVQATGDMGNQPSTGFFENPPTGTEIFEICDDAACTNHTTVFSTGQTVYLRINSTVVSNVTGRDQLKVCNYFASNCPVNLNPANWNVSGTGPYIFTNNFTAPSTADWWYIDAFIEDGGGDRFKVGDAIKVGTATPEHYIRFFVDENFTISSTTHFSSNALYYQMYGSGDTYDAGNTLPRIRDFQDNSDSTLNETCVQAGNVYNCSIDLSTIDDISFRNAEWYTLDPKMKNASGGRIFDNTMAMFVIYNNSLYDSRDTSPPSSGGTWSVNEDVYLNGSGWESLQTIRINITDPTGSTVHDQEHQADGNGNFTEEYADLGTDYPSGTYTVYVSTDGGSTWLQYDTFTVSAIPEFPFGSSIAILAAAIIYVLIRRGLQQGAEKWTDLR